MSIPTESIASLPEYLQLIEERYTGNYSALFRGQRCDDWNLVPRIGRTRFRKRFSSLLETEKDIFDEFERLSVPHRNGLDVTSPWDRLALAQHHGLPTRLLDWTTNPMVALWFAVESPPERERNAAVWIFSAEKSDYVTEGTDPFSPPKTLIFRPPHLDTRIISQSGWFTVHKYMKDKSKFIPLDNNKNQKTKLRKLIIESRCFPALRDDLARCGITRSSLFPGLSGLCGHLLWQYSLLPDELEYDDCFVDE